MKLRIADWRLRITDFKNSIHNPQSEIRNAVNSQSTIRNSQWTRHSFSRGGQATLELTLAMIIGLLIVVATIKVWVFFVEMIVAEQYDYQASRKAAGQNGNPGLHLHNASKCGAGLDAPDYGNPFWLNGRPRLSIFGPTSVRHVCP